MSGCPLSPFYSTRLNGPFRDSSEIDGKTNPKNKTEALCFSALFSCSQPHGALSTPNILQTVKPPIKICFSLPHIAGQSLRNWESESGWKATSETSQSSSLTLISQCLAFYSSDRVFSCHAKHMIPFNCCPGATDRSRNLLSGQAAGEADRDATVYFIYYLWKVSILGEV